MKIRKLLPPVACGRARVTRDSDPISGARVPIGTQAARWTLQEQPEGLTCKELGLLLLLDDRLR